MDNTEIQTILQTLGERVPRSSRLVLVGGSALALHFCHTEPYPILDVCALWSLGAEASAAVYNFEFW